MNNQQIILDAMTYTWKWLIICIAIGSFFLTVHIIKEHRKGHTVYTTIRPLRNNIYAVLAVLAFGVLSYSVVHDANENEKENLAEQQTEPLSISQKIASSISSLLPQDLSRIDCTILQSNNSRECTVYLKEIIGLPEITVQLVNQKNIAENLQILEFFRIEVSETNDNDSPVELYTGFKGSYLDSKSATAAMANTINHAWDKAIEFYGPAYSNR